jgi:hypothetical protein
VTPDPGYTNWARWIDSRVDRVPFEFTVALWVIGIPLVIILAS